MVKWAWLDLLISCYNFLVVWEATMWSTINKVSGADLSTLYLELEEGEREGMPTKCLFFIIGRNFICRL